MVLIAIIIITHIHTVRARTVSFTSRMSEVPTTIPYRPMCTYYYAPSADNRQLYPALHHVPMSNQVTHDEKKIGQVSFILITQLVVPSPHRYRHCCLLTSYGAYCYYYNNTHSHRPSTDGVIYFKNE